MYICVCKGVTGAQIKEAVIEGAASLRAVRLQLGVASQCGRCTEDACAIIKATKAEQLYQAQESKG